MFRMTKEMKGKIYGEVQSLRKVNYRIATKITAGDLAIHIVSESGNDVGIIFLDDNGVLRPLSPLSEQELEKFIESFPKTNAPTLAKALEDFPPIPEDPKVSATLLDMLQVEGSRSCITNSCRN